MTTELQYQSKETERVLKANAKLSAENRALRRQLELHEEARDLMATRTQGFQKLIAKLQARLRGYEQHEAAFAASMGIPNSIGPLSSHVTGGQGGGFGSTGMLTSHSHDSGMVTGGAEGRLKWMKELRAAGAIGSSSIVSMSGTSQINCGQGVPQSPSSSRLKNNNEGSSGIGRSSRHRSSGGRARRSQSGGGGGGMNDEKGDSSDDGSLDGNAVASKNNPLRTPMMATAAARLTSSIGSIPSSSESAPVGGNSASLSPSSSSIVSSSPSSSMSSPSSGTSSLPPLSSSSSMNPSTVTNSTSVNTNGTLPELTRPSSRPNAI